MLLPSFLAENGNSARVLESAGCSWGSVTLLQKLLSVFSSLQALEQANLDSEGISLSLEEQLSAMTLSEPDSGDPQSMVYLLGSPFGVDLFEITRQSTKVLRL